MQDFICAYFEAIGLVLMLEVAIACSIVLECLLPSILAPHSNRFKTSSTWPD